MVFRERFSELSEVVSRCLYSTPHKKVEATAALELFHDFLLQIQEKGGSVFVIGNGGSAGIASHFAIDLLNSAHIPAHTLYDSNMMTCISNDYGYDEVFSRPLDLLLKERDLLVCISSSGKSKSILQGAMAAVEKGVPVITFTGFEPNNFLRAMGDLNFYLPVTDYGLVEMGHFFLLHTLIDAWNLTSTELRSNLVDVQ